MSVYKLVDVVGTSETSLSDAIRGAVERAGQTLDDCEWFEVKEIRGNIKGGQVGEYQVKLDVAFKLHAPDATSRTGTRSSQKTTGTRQARSMEAQTARKGGQNRRSDPARGIKEKSTRKAKK